MEDKITVQNDTANVSSRIIAFLIDSIIVFLIFAVLDKAIFKFNLTDNLTNQINDSLNKGLFFAFYYVLFAAFIFKGQSIGKKIMNIKIVRENSEGIDLMTLLNREVLCRVFVERINLWILLLLSYTGILQRLVEGINSRHISIIIWYLISLPWFMFVSFIMMVNSSEHLSLHDRISKTKVISLKKY